jgi:hypothetical protein
LAIQVVKLAGKAARGQRGQIVLFTFGINTPQIVQFSGDNDIF